VRERAGLIGDLSRWVLRSACQEAAGWPVGPDGLVLNLAVNISAGQLSDLQHRRGRPAGAGRGRPGRGGLVLEVTETAAVGRPRLRPAHARAARRLGVGLALDDFGTGYSSLSHVHALPFDILKVDRSFVSACQQGDRRAVATIAAVGRSRRRSRWTWSRKGSSTAGSCRRCALSAAASPRATVSPGR
jgi:EAL domain-containing protein (putative c-di-GMP-specific phosphodiesterase class I)